MTVDQRVKASSEPSHSEYLFAYGTLQPHLAPAEVADLVRSLENPGKGTIAGTLYDFGSYPGVVLGRLGGRRVVGTVFRLPKDSRILRKLDGYEEFDCESLDTSQFIRRLCPVQLADGRVLECWIYEYNRSVDNAPILESGIYIR